MFTVPNNLNQRSNTPDQEQISYCSSSAGSTGVRADDQPQTGHDDQLYRRSDTAILNAEGIERLFAQNAHSDISVDPSDEDEQSDNIQEDILKNINPVIGTFNI